MITLPPTLQVQRDEAAEKVLYDQARGWIENERRTGGIHASDLLMPRKGYWRAVDPLPPSDREIGLFLVGKILHAFVLHSGAEKSVRLAVTDEGSKYDEELALWYSPDKLLDGKVAEFKTSRAFYEPKEIRDIDTYLQQLLIYMGVERIKVGEVWVLYVNAKDASGKTSPAFRVFRIEIGDDELEATRLEIRNTRDSLARAKAAKNHSGLELCPAWACHPDQCPYWTKCKPEGRYESPSYLAGKRK